MNYKETPEDIANEDDEDEGSAGASLDPSEELKFEGEGESIAIVESLDDVSDDLTEKPKAKTTFSLKARRAIEDHLEKRRLRQELDYLFDDDKNSDNSTKES